MKQTDIYEAYLDPIIGSVQGGRRPVVIISGNLINSRLNNVIMCPLTSSIKNYKGNPILRPNESNGLTLPSEIMVFQIRSLSKERLKKKIGHISNDHLEQIKETLGKLLSY
jgi:mRNA interferase MazF